MSVCPVRREVSGIVGVMVSSAVWSSLVYQHR
ncbi:hypothetical protein Mycsm_00733 [Mycobacterium sp. JS623]|nr:hypothetical protein Mycsm_00733 [Mycobacterium sp. JS623]